MIQSQVVVSAGTKEEQIAVLEKANVQKDRRIKLLEGRVEDLNRQVSSILEVMSLVESTFERIHCDISVNNFLLILIYPPRAALCDFGKHNSKFRDTNNRFWLNCEGPSAFRA